MWGIIKQPHPYQDAAWDAVWNGEGQPPHTPFGRPVPVFNTSHKKAQACADYFNGFITEKTK